VTTDEEQPETVDRMTPNELRQRAAERIEILIWEVYRL